MTDGLPLFDWMPPQDESCMMIAFPLHRRMGKVRDVADKLATKKTERHIEQYKTQVSAALHAQMVRNDIEPGSVEREIDRFWQLVNLEMARRRTLRRGPGAA